MRRLFGQLSIAFVVLASPAAAQRGSSGMSPSVAIGISAQNRDYRAILGLAARAGVSGPVLRRLDWAADISIERFGDGDPEFAPCPADSSCRETPDDIALAHGSGVLVFRDDAGPGAYLLAGAGLTRILTSGESAKRTYTHATAGIGWPFRRDGAGPFLELRFNKFLRPGEPMPAWTVPLVLGFRF